MIKEVKKYTDDEGRSVTAYIPLSDIVDKIDYEGQVGIQTPMGIAPIRFPFPENYTLEQCYENFEKIATEEVNRVVKEAEKKAKEVEEQTKNENLILTPEQIKRGQPIPFLKK